MPDLEKKATRQSYGEALVELGKAHSNLVVLDADVAGATKTELFQKAFPSRFIECGIAEGNMMGVAAGLASSGYIPFVSSFAMFAAGRAYEQIRNAIGYPNLPVKIGATHGGISVGEDGATHQCNEDFALMRSIPGMTVICPADDVEAKEAVKAAFLHEGPVYLRFGRMPVPTFHLPENYRFELGKGIVYQEGSDVTIIANGLMVYPSLEAAQQLEKEGLSVGVVNIHTLKPIDQSLILHVANESQLLVTAEEHSIIGGLGSAVCEVLCEEDPRRVLRLGMKDCFGMSGPATQLLNRFGLTAEGIAHQIRKALS